MSILEGMTDYFWLLLLSAGAAWIVHLYWRDAHLGRGRRLDAWHRAEVQKDARFPGTTLRQQVLQRDRHRCVDCEATENLHIDHIIPHSYGGQTTFDNLQVLCAQCNLRKGAKMPAGAKLPEVQGPPVSKKEQMRIGQERLGVQRRRRQEAAAKAQVTKAMNRKPSHLDQATLERIRMHHGPYSCSNCRVGRLCWVRLEREADGRQI
jgi:hypothetical protein